MAAEDWQRLADYVIARREALGYKTRRQFADKLGGRPSLRTLSQLETGRSVDGNTLAAVQAQLGWGPGSCRRILAGGEPELAGDGDPPQRLTRLGQHLAQRRGALDERWRHASTFATETHVDPLLVEAAEIRVDPQLSDGHVHQLARAYKIPVETLREALAGDDVVFPEPTIDAKDARIRAALLQLDETQKTVLVGLIESWLHPAPPAAAEQEHRRTA